MAFLGDGRYFTNNFRDYDDGSYPKGRTPVVDTKFVRNLLIQTADLVFSKQKHDTNGGLYVGAVGLTYSYLHIRPVLSVKERERFLPLAQKLYDRHAKYYADHKPDIKELPAFLHGKAGFDAVGAVLGKLTGNEKLQKHSLENYAYAAQFCKPVNFQPRGGDELLVGRAGYLLGALWLQEQFGDAFQPVPKQDLKDVWDAILKSGRGYSEANRSPCPLMYAYHGKEYLGAAHGVCSILQVLLSFPEFLKTDLKAESDIKATVDYYLTLQDEQGNFPSSTGKTGLNHLVHWCHGATGASYLFAKAYLHYGDPKYLNVCIACGEVIWQKGLLKKGPGICHGVAGNGYVFLLLHRLQKEEEFSSKWLYRAAKFAEFLDDDEFAKHARTPDRPFSLYEGLAGTLCFLADLLQPENANFPFFNIFYNYKTDS